MSTLSLSDCSLTADLHATCFLKFSTSLAQEFTAADEISDAEETPSSKRFMEFFIHELRE